MGKRGRYVARIGDNLRSTGNSQLLITSGKIGGGSDSAGHASNSSRIQKLPGTPDVVNGAKSLTPGDHSEPRETAWRKKT